MGAGSASPVVSTITRRNGAIRLLSQRRSKSSRVAMRSPRTVQHRHPAESRIIFSSTVSTSRWSSPISPNSLTMITVSASAGSWSSRLSSVVLPAPRKPVSTVNGIGGRERWADPVMPCRARIGLLFVRLFRFGGGLDLGLRAGGLFGVRRVGLFLPLRFGAPPVGVAAGRRGGFLRGSGLLARPLAGRNRGPLRLFVVGRGSRLFPFGVPGCGRDALRLVRSAERAGGVDRLPLLAVLDDRGGRSQHGSFGGLRRGAPRDFRARQRLGSGRRHGRRLGRGRCRLGAPDGISGRVGPGAEARPAPAAPRGGA